MVGVPGKSKACLDCKRRRVKCDFTLPHCLRCAKARIACRGYEKAKIWVNRTPEHPSVTAPSVLADARIQRTSAESLSWRQLRILGQLREEISQGTYDTIDFRQQSFVILQSIYLPQPHIAAIDEDENPLPSSWVRAICRLKSANAALDHSLLAFTAIQIRASGEPSVSREETEELYTRALGKVIEGLDPRHFGGYDETLAAIVILSTCELFVLPTSSSWSAHAQGISELLRHRDMPEKYSESWKSLCERLFIICVIQAFTQRRPLSLEPERWRHLIGSPYPPDSWSSFLYMVIDIPSMLHEAHKQVLLQNEKNSGCPASPSVLLLSRKYCELENWRRHRQQRASSNGPLYWAVPSKLENPADAGYEEKLFPFAISFRSIGNAVAWIFCSTIMLQVAEMFLTLNELYPSTSEVVDCDHVSKTDADNLAIMLCQCIEYFYHSNNGTFGPHSTCCTQLALRRYFSRRGLSRQLAWCKAIKNISGPELRCGLNLMEFGFDD